MTDEEFQNYLANGVDLRGQHVTGRVLLPGRHSNGVRVDCPFVIQINRADELSLRFMPDESLDSRLAKVDAALDRWMVLRPSPPPAEPSGL